MDKIFKIFRYSSYVAIICSLIGSLVLFAIGAWETYEAIEILITQDVQGHGANIQFSDASTTYVLKALDTFLIALVLIIFAKGIYTLFISSNQNNEDHVFNWANIPNIGHLKNTLAEVIIVILFVIFLEVIFENLHDLKWEYLILPLSILILALALKFLKLKHEE
jgi:uncharacterized membrane protein YqhA